MPQRRTKAVRSARKRPPAADPPAAACGGRNARGKPCGMPPLEGGDRCWAHAPEKGRERALARREGGRRRQASAAAPAGAAPVPLRSPEEILTQLEQVMGDTLAQGNSALRSRTVGYLLQVALRTLEVGELEARVKAIEEYMAARPGRPRLVGGSA